MRLQTANSSSLTINGGINFGSPAGARVTAPVILGDSQTWTQTGGNNTIKEVTGGTDLNGHTLTWNSTNNGGNSAFRHSNITGSGNLVKDGAGLLRLVGTNDYTGTTTVSAGSLYVQGALSGSAVTVGANGTIGSDNGSSGGTLGNGLTIEAGGTLDLTGATLGLTSTGILGLTGGSLTLGNLTFQDLVGWDWANASEGTYQLISGSFSVDFGSTAYLDEDTAYVFGNGTMGGYFTQGSLNAVIFVIPEPSTALLGGLGLLALLRRRR